MLSKLNYSNNKFRNTLNDLRWDKTLCDVILVTRSNIEFSAHKIILSAASPHFRRMFSTGSGYIAPQIERISLENVDPFVFSEIINYVYTGEINLITDYAQTIFITSQLLQFNELLELCIEFIGENIELENCLNIYEFSTKYDLVDLDEKTINFICENFSNVIKTEKFLTLSPSQVNKLLAKTKSTINREELIFDGILKWIIQKNFKKEIGNFFRFLNVAQLPNKYLIDFIDKISNDPKVPNGTELIEFLLPVANKKKSNAKDIFVFTCQDDEANMFIRAFDINNKEWCMEILLRSYQKHSKLAILDNKLYILSSTKQLDEYDLETSSWSMKTPIMNKINRSTDLIVADNKIYCIANESCAIYEPKINKWTKFSIDSHMGLGFSVVSYCNDIFFIGGYLMKHFDKTIKTYNLITKKWNKTLKIKTERYWHASVVMNDRLYILGGRNEQDISLQSMEIYDISKNVWEENVMELPIARSGHLAAVYENEIFVFGGNGSNGELVEQIDVYTSVTNKWYTLDEKCLAGSWLNSVVLVNSDITKMTPFSL